ncbi:UDP-N-acetylmuramoyl-tripeptide--D-alanyl-D-alanine ligase [Myxacorys almedinensis]|uniref:UDP-N-acetylmuramoyl-tripeptide--D-alanyl-D-alanine ligase n=1 Tax=Myxacorys almedinensis A TaxID=2690445 RepID=A0A8J8CJ69_9CYAN|nr:UDP-N-acetylmuramoyl-tripeptide--D-alanyl-D-alanine ligase [Myxacorys almedinensis]NDJ18693.1 UDP-N-acetylmuramoyl-tripeptide--D-alanyl-D-alanine ligase [Myxacorys almedinensis A]
MPFHASLAQIIAVLDASTHHLFDQECIATGITTDSRNLQPGEVFLALRGETFDGHGFVESALAQGAVAAIVDTAFPTLDLPLIVVNDTLAAYQALGQWWRSQFDIPIIAITGSVGKTTTKEILAAVLARYGRVLKTQANYNNEIGVPKTLLELSDEHDFAVVEMGMRAKGEIALLSQIASPDVAVITNVGTAHIGRLGSRAAIAQAKCELLAEMPSDAIAVLNHDNPLLLETAARVWHGKTITYGLSGGDVQGQIRGGGIRVGDLTFQLPLAGEHNALNFLSALGVATALNLEWSAIASGLEVELPGGRSRRYELANDIVLLDETYNAGLESMLASLKLLAQTPGNRKVAVLGTMKELGSWAVAYHRQVGEQVKALGLDELLILADEAEAEALAQGALPLASECFVSHGDVIDRLSVMVKPGDRILFKASRSVGLDRVVEGVRSAIAKTSPSTPS